MTAPPATLGAHPTGAPLRRLVFVADDLGESPRTNAGIAAALAAGAVRETSLMVTGAAVEEGARVARAVGAGVGLHLSFTQGRALTGALHGLTRRDGAFLSLASVLLSCRLGVPRADEVRREVDAQLDRLASLGIDATHVNGHHHAHAFPRIRDAVCAAVRTRGIPYLRVPLERAATGGRLSLRRAVVTRQARGLLRAMAAHGLLAPPLAFVGLALESRRDFRPRLERTLALLADGPAEVMVHPRTEDPRGAAELACLADAGFVGHLRARGFEPVTFAQAMGGKGP